MPLVKLTHVSTVTSPEGTSLLSFKPDRLFTHEAGQFGLWIAGGSARPFTIASSPNDEFIQLGTRLHSGSKIKRKLEALEPGDTIRLFGPFGKIAPPDDGTPIIYVTQGIGITPARAIIREKRGAHQTLIHVGAPYFKEELGAAVDEASYPAGRAELASALDAAVKSEPNAHFLVAGSPAFVKDTSAGLKAGGVAADRIHADAFMGLPDPGAQGAGEG